MRIWLIKDGETLAVDPNNRKMRTGLLADYLVAENHHVIWWASTFSHQRKKLLAHFDETFTLKSNYQINMIHAGTYQKNISFARFQHHRNLAKRLTNAFAKADKPDVIICAFPIIEVAYAALQYAKRNNIPFIIDVRDIWPDLFIHRAPKYAGRFVRLLLNHYFKQTKAIFSKADSITAISPGILRWAQDYAPLRNKQYDRVIYHGYTPKAKSQPSAAIHELIQQLQGKTILTYTGTFAGAYDLNIVCEAAAMLATHPHIHFILAGDGENFPEISAKCKSLNNISLPGWLDQNDLLYLLKHSSAGLLPWNCIDNAMPNKVFEYISQGLPIISSATGDLQLMLAQEQFGLHYESGDIDTLCKHILTISKNHEYYCKNALQAYQDKYNAMLNHQRMLSLATTLTEECASAI